MDRYIMHRGEPLMDNNDLFGYTQEAEELSEFVFGPFANLPRRYWR